MKHSPGRTSRLVFRAALLIASLTCTDAARAADENPFVDSGGEALRERLQIPWYDAQTDDLRRITVAPPRDPINSRSLAWLARPVYIAVIVLICALLVLLAWLIVRIVRNRQRGHGVSHAAQVAPLLVADRVEALPFLRERSSHDLLGQARQHYQAGNYSEAIIYLFSYELVELDRFALVRLAKGKTNRQYLREVRQLQPLGAMLQRTMSTFEDVFFGRRALDRESFEACWNQLDQFEALVSRAQQSA